jgi:hypothetical protein
MRTEVAVFDTVFQDMIGGGQHGGSHCENRLLGAASGFQTQELRVQVRAFDAYRGPGGCDQCSLEPSGATFAGTLVVAGTEGCPGQQVCSAGKARHVDADLRHDDVRGDAANPGHRRQKAGALLDRRQVFSHRSIDVGEGMLEACDEFQMYFQQSSMVVANAAVERLEQFAALLAGGALSQVSEFFRIVLSGDKRGEDGAAALTENV